MPQTNVGEAVRVKKIPRKTADTVLVTPLDLTSVLPEKDELEQFAKVLQGLPVMWGIRSMFLSGGKRTTFYGGSDFSLRRGHHQSKDQFPLKEPDFSMEAPSHVSYENVGGLAK